MAASNVDLIVTSASGIVGAIIGSLISGLSARTQRNADFDGRVHEAFFAVNAALDDLRASESAETSRALRQSIIRLMSAALSAGIDSQIVYVLGRVQLGLLRWPEFRDTRKELVLESLGAWAAVLVVSASRVPRWRRHGRWMPTYLREEKLKADALESVPFI